MNPKRWREIRAIFDEVVERDPGQRRQLLLDACGSDVELHTEVERLLQAADEAGGFLERPALGDPSGPSGKGEYEGKVVTGSGGSSYDVVRRIGHGGMGAVYLARRRGAPQSPDVALKVIKRGMDTEFVVNRFRSEREILGGLDHPNIARLLDGGATEDGLPFFVMEYIEGEPIQRYCQQHGLTTDERVELFRQVCAAVSYAHANLVVHRDIKPSNIVVTTEGAPKLLDFGLAKVLGPELPNEPASRTATALRMLTPEYASPEQVRGDRITTVSDVYSLGVLLYELLLGRRPYRIPSQNPQEIARAICELPPEKPIPDDRLPDDLGNILLMALRKEPQRRYASVDQFSEDLRRYLAKLPVAARPDTFAYRAQTFLRRNRAGVVAAAVVAVAVVGGVTATVWQARVAEVQRARAERRYRDLRALAGSLLFEFDEAITDLPGSTSARELLVKRALDYLSALEHESAGDLSLQRELAVAFSRVGEVQSRGFGLHLGDTSGALESFHKAMLIRQTLVDADPKNLEDQDSLAESLLQMAQVMGQMGDATDYIAYARQAATIREVLVAADPDNAAFRSGLAAAYGALGGALMREADLAEMLVVFRRLQALREELLAAEPASPRARGDLADAYNNLGVAQALLADRGAAQTSWGKARAIGEELVAANPGSERFRSTLMRSYTLIGGNLNALGERRDALAYLKRAVSIGETLYATDPKNADIRHRLAETYRDLGQTFAEAGAAAEATVVLTKALGLLEKWSKANPSNVQISVTLAGVYEALGVAHEPPPGHRGSHPADASWQRARAWYQRSLEVWHDLAARDRLARLYRTRTEAVAEEVVRCDAALVGSR